MAKIIFMFALICTAVSMAYCQIDFLASFRSFLNGFSESYSGPQKEVCYGKYGCFSIEAPFNAPGRIADLPDRPANLGTQFVLFTRLNPSTEFQLKAGNVSALQLSRYNGRSSTKIIIHGWGDIEHFWPGEMKNAFLKNEDCNVILVKYPDNFQVYSKSAANARVIGAQVAELVRWLIAQTSTNLAAFHILGHSLGAQIAGYAGERLMPGLGRITGMDPAGPMFENTDRSVRLDETDAEFVDIIHTDSANSILNLLNFRGGFGLSQPSGHVDIYPNGGFQQAGCYDKTFLMEKLKSNSVSEAVRGISGCHHMRGYEYPNESLVLDTCPWRAYRCDGGWEKFKTGLCLRCPTTGPTAKYCNNLVSQAIKPQDGSVSNAFYLATGPEKPYCRFHFHVKFGLQSNRGNGDQRGDVWVKLIGRQRSTDFLQFGEGSFIMEAGGSYDFLVLSPTAVQQITAIELKWESNDQPVHVTPLPVIHPKNITIFSGEFQAEATFIDQLGSALQSGDSRRYNAA